MLIDDSYSVVGVYRIIGFCQKPLCNRMRIYWTEPAWFRGREFVIVVITRRVVNVAYSPFRFCGLVVSLVLSFLYIVKKAVNLILIAVHVISFDYCYVHRSSSSTNQILCVVTGHDFDKVRGRSPQKYHFQQTNLTFTTSLQTILISGLSMEAIVRYGCIGLMPCLLVFVCLLYEQGCPADIDFLFLSSSFFFGLAQRDTWWNTKGWELDGREVEVTAWKRQGMRRCGTCGSGSLL